MPLLATDYSWTQTHATVHVSVPLKGATAAKVDIVSTDEYLKLHFPPFLFEAFLFEPVDNEQSSAKIGNGVALVSLTKRSNNQWESLTINTYDKEQKKEIREKALLKYQEKLVADTNARAERLQTEKKYTLETMMKLEQAGRERIQKIKEDERARTTAELQAWQLEQQRRAKEEERSAAEARHRAQRQRAKPTKAHNETRGRSQSESKKKPAPPPPPPRTSGSIQVTFTPRVFPTALRESRVPEEEEWLRKQAEARRSLSADADELKDLTDEEKNPDWLKEKGDKCFTTGNFQGALNAYSLAIRLNPRIPALYSNRAACYLKMKNLHRAVEDSSQALQLLTPPVPANAAARARAHVRRGTAFCQLELFAEGLQDYQAALKIRPDDKALQEDAQKIRDVIQGSGAPRAT